MQTTPDQRSVVHSTFSIERIYSSPPSRVFAAFSDQETKRRWFAEGEGWEIEEFTLDFRVGGREISRFRFKGGAPMGNDTIYLDVVLERRIVFAYTMTVGGQPISISLATVELVPSDDGTRLVYTEQGAFFDGADKAEGRAAGGRQLLEKLGEELGRYQ
jgi:uncharacterized protein YndB with AHSA1/START domain